MLLFDLNWVFCLGFLFLFFMWVFLCGFFLCWFFVLCLFCFIFLFVFVCFSLKISNGLEHLPITSDGFELYRKHSSEHVKCTGSGT